MTEDIYVIAITVLLPVTAGMLVSQKNPYHALVIRGILGAVAALVYALFGAADVALTEALVGTMLSITLYAVAVRSSLSMRLGVLDEPSEQLLDALRVPLSKYHMRLELVTYPDLQALHTALQAREVHSICVLSEQLPDEKSSPPTSLHHGVAPYHLQTRIPRLHEVMQAELPSTLATLSCIKLASPQSAEAQSPNAISPQLLPAPKFPTS
jgi:putative multicomponent Na+:H+ antiporter subunit B